MTTIPSLEAEREYSEDERRKFLRVARVPFLRLAQAALNTQAAEAVGDSNLQDGE